MSPLLIWIYGIVRSGTGMSGIVRRRTNKETGEYRDDFYYRCKYRKKINETDFYDYKPSLNQNELDCEVEQMVTTIVNNSECGEFIGYQRGWLRKYQDMQDRLDNLYDKIGDIEELLKEINEKINRVYGKNNIKTGLSNFTVL